MDINTIIAKVFTGEATDEELRQLDAYLQENPAEAKSLNFIKALKGKGDLSITGFSHQETFDELTQHVNTPSEKKVKKLDFKPYLRIAASILLVIAGVAIFNSYQNTPTEIITSPQEWVRATKSGEKRNFFLPDGSNVWLNAESEVRFSASFGQDSIRLVYLKGEGYFNVAKDAEHPFIVRTDYLDVTALGTEFNVNAYDEEHHGKVALAEGRVKVEPNRKGTSCKEAFLDAGQSAQLDMELSKITKAELDGEEDYCWTKKIISFNQANINHILKTLTRWYGVEFTVSGKLPDNWRFKGEFHNESLDNVLKSIGFSQNFSYQIKGKKVELKF
ncbi:DUF4974 domain-containing protein [Flammeovirgaceae bacterium SG7u.111]|nr:DUF4974 domain-containing protein [Flammeovirgaceae bacterium SG7u.132]WPO35025.1 DUF4974 domain-containing protein [Flammeovirgaceae bacterium SG7u.111]